MTERLEPRAEKKSPKVLISSGDKFLEMMQDKVLAKVTSSQPERQLRDFINITCFILCLKIGFMIKKIKKI